MKTTQRKASKQKGAKIDPERQNNKSVEESEAQQESNSWVESMPWFLQSHSVWSFFFIHAILQYLQRRDDIIENLGRKVSFTKQDSKSTFQQNFHILGALAACTCVFVYIFAIPSGKIQAKYPHMMYWRVLYAVIVAYSLAVTYMLLLPLDQALDTVKMLDADLGDPIMLPKARETCQAFTPEHPEGVFAGLMGNIINVHMVAHLFGWAAKMLLIRDWHMCWIASVGWEIHEVVCKQFQLNMYECWWDHLFLDLFGMNFAGKVVAYYFMSKYGYKWLPWASDPRLADQQVEELPEGEHSALISALDSLRPEWARSKQWVGLANLRNFLACNLVYLHFCFSDFNTFLLGLNLNAITRHPFFGIRILTVYACSWGMVYEMWCYWVRRDKHMGPFLWIQMYLLTTEFMLAMKHSEKHFNEVIPYQCKIILSIWGTVLLWLGSMALSNQLKASARTKSTSVL